MWDKEYFQVLDFLWVLAWRPQAGELGLSRDEKELKKKKNRGRGAQTLDQRSRLANGLNP